MLTYPVTIPIPKRGLPKSYHPSALPRCRKTLEDYLNRRAKDSRVTVLTYPQIANGTELDKEIVKIFLKPLTGSSSGITITNPELED